MIRLICIDVDGTLVGTSGAVDPRSWAAADRAREAGIHLAICSGRPGFGVTRGYAERLNPAGWHAFQNGASVVDLPSGRSLSSPLAPETVSALVARARQTGRTLELYTDSEYAVESLTDRAREHATLLGLTFMPRWFESLAGPIVRAQWLIDHADVERVAAEPHAGLELFPSTSPIMPDTTFVNLTRSGTTKATAVRIIAEEYGVALDEVMFVGDGENDVPAMAVVGYAVAMANAEPEVHALARCSVAHVDDGGLVEALDLALAVLA